MSEGGRYTGEDRRFQPRQTIFERDQLEEELQKRSDELTYEKIRTGEISQLEFLQMLGEIRRRATEDVLTGLGNRRAFRETVEKMWEEEGGFSVLILDIDHFKKFNDTYGHETGDEVLRCLGQTAGKISIDGKFFRLGGEEFAVLLPNSEGEKLVAAAKMVGEELIEGWARDENLIARNVGRVTVSIGGRSIKPGESWEELVNKTDEYLYQAKRADAGGEGRQRAMVEMPDGEVKEVSFREKVDRKVS